MGKGKNKPSKSSALSELAGKLLAAMASEPSRLEYATRLLGGSFKDSDVERLDQAYLELADRGLIERSTASVSFFGVLKVLYRITEKGLARAGKAA
jgi:hypothetical protein